MSKKMNEIKNNKFFIGAVAVLLVVGIVFISSGSGKQLQGRLGARGAGGDVGAAPEARVLMPNLKFVKVDYNDFSGVTVLYENDSDYDIDADYSVVLLVDGVEVSRTEQSRALAAGDDKYWESGYTFQVGDKKAEVILDYGNAIEESNEEDNEKLSAAVFPDLIVEDLWQFPTDLERGFDAEVYVQVKNIGNHTIDGDEIEDRYLLYSGIFWDTQYSDELDDYETQFYFSEAFENDNYLKPGGTSLMVIETRDIVRDFDPPEQSEMVFCIDGSENIVESKEDNNCFVIPDTGIEMRDRADYPQLFR